MIPVVPSVAAQPLKRKASLPGSELGRDSALAADQPGRDINDVFDEIGKGNCAQSVPQTRLRICDQ